MDYFSDCAINLMLPHYSRQKFNLKRNQRIRDQKICFGVPNEIVGPKNRHKARDTDPVNE